jgi:hypothetical protein
METVPQQSENPPLLQLPGQEDRSLGRVEVEGALEEILGLLSVWDHGRFLQSQRKQGFFTGRIHGCKVSVLGFVSTASISSQEGL